MEQEYCTKVLQDFKYYKGEGTIDENPFSHEDVRFRFWHGECMFANTLIGCKNEEEVNEHLSVWAKGVPRWRSWLKKHKPNQSAHFLRENTDRQLAIAAYIVTLFSKWCPYDSEDFIYDY